MKSFFSLLHAGKCFLLFCNILTFSPKTEFFQNFFQEYHILTVSKSLDPYQAQQFVWPDLGLNCLQMPDRQDPVNG